MTPAVPLLLLWDRRCNGQLAFITKTITGEGDIPYPTIITLPNDAFLQAHITSAVLETLKLEDIEGPSHVNWVGQPSPRDLQNNHLIEALGLFYDKQGAQYTAKAYVHAITLC